MTKEDYIKYWIDTSNDDWSTSSDLYITKHYLQSLFFAHLTLEKLCKAIWVKEKESNHPPRIHNLVSILRQTTIDITHDRLDFLLVFNDFQLEGRYPDYLGKVHQMCTESTTKDYLEKVEQHRLWLLSKLQ